MDFRLDKYLQKDHFSWSYRTSTNIRPRPWRVVRLILLFGLSSSPQVSSTLPGARPPAKPWRQGPSRGGRRHRCRKLVPSSWHIRWILELGNQNHPLLRAELGSLPLDTYNAHIATVSFRYAFFYCVGFANQKIGSNMVKQKKAQRAVPFTMRDS